ncbi:MAG: sulfatase, partial [Planctomycetota bacterium]
MNIKIYIVLLLLAGAVVAALFFWGGNFFGREIRNVLLISIDTCRADRLSCYGYRRKTTPNIDAIAEEGILFENAITPATMTLPAHCSMLTGTIPPYHGVHDNPDYQLAESNVTLAEMLTDKGFTCGAAVSAFIMDSEFGLDQGFDVYDDRFDKEIKSLGTVERRGSELTDHAISWLQKHHNENFFLFLHYYDPHFPYEPPEPFGSKFIGNPYAGEVAYTDHCIGQVIKKLKELDLYDSTLLVITSDHGEALGEHSEGTHGYFVYQSTLKVPLIFKVPGRRKAVRITDDVSLIDIVPTICGLMEIPVPTWVQGRDLSRYFSKKSYSAPERYLYCESFIPTKYDCNH